MSMAARIAEEREAQSRWRPRKPGRIERMVDRLLVAEFLEPRQVRADESQRLARALGFARKHVPFYRGREGWFAAEFRADLPGRDMLAPLPILSKHDVQESLDVLRAERVPKGHKGAFIRRSSGTTGRPTEILYSRPAYMAFGLMLQRHMRWERVDPLLKQAYIRLPRDVPPRPDGSYLGAGETFRPGCWNWVGQWFHTGPEVVFSRTNRLEAQVAWLRQERPEYLITFPGTLETLVYECQGKPVDSLRGLRTISATLTEGMRNRIESATGLRVQQNYGLNEVGIVAIRCAAGRYHVNAEQYVVEILDDDGKPSRPGEAGRVVVTALRNYAMPLIRYDSGDLAVVVEGPCDCGRTLPSFGRIVGRYRAMRHTPDGTSQRLNLIADTINDMPLEMLAGLREYQLHQFRDGRFELRLVTRGEPSPAFLATLREAWDGRFDESTPLKILPVDSIPLGPGGKQQEFTSDFFPPVDEGSEISGGSG